MNRSACSPRRLWGTLWVPCLFGALLGGLALPATSQPSGSDSLPPVAGADSLRPVTSPAAGALHDPLTPSDSPQPSEADPAVTALDDRDARVFALPTTHDHIGRVVVPVMVNGRGPFRFIVDTGANHSTISPGLVRTLGLKTSDAPSIVLDGITGTAQVSFVTIDRLQAGDLTIDETALPVVWAPVMAGADGILGAAGLAEKSLSVDFQRNRVVIARNVEPVMRRESVKLHALRLTHGLITLETRVGGVPVRAVIDTGAERTLGNLALRDALKSRLTRGAVAQVTTVYGATKEVELGEIRAAPLIAIDSVRITDVAIVFGQFHIFKVWGMQDKPAMIIGMDVLGTVASLGIDFKNQDVYVAGLRIGNNPLDSMHGGNLGNQMQKK